MALKEDFYSGAGSNMHAAYNIQIIVSKGIALTYYVGQERTDSYAFIPAIEQFRADYGFYPKNLCADAGYGSWKTMPVWRNAVLATTSNSRIGNS